MATNIKKSAATIRKIRENASIGVARIDSLLTSKNAEERALGRSLKSFFDQITADANDALMYLDTY